MQDVIVIFDVGKTNKKLIVFNSLYEVVHEENIQLAETVDEDNFPCEDIHGLSDWIKDSLNKILNNPEYNVKAVNFSAYGASLVYLDKIGKVIAPLYNYLKPYPEKLQDEFYNKYGGEKLFAKETASPVLGSLNSGMQLYRLKYEKQGIFKQLHCALHLPQYLSSLITNKKFAEITSIGCHTNLWNFKTQSYHQWIYKEDIAKFFPVVAKTNSSVNVDLNNKKLVSGIGMHDSSAALIPYLHSFNTNFVLISTGTWCISLNPFNNDALTVDELQNDCLCYLSNNNKQIKASRLFAGYKHEIEVKRLSQHFNKPLKFFTKIKFDYALLNSSVQNKNTTGSINFDERNLNEFESYEQAYHHLINDILKQQAASTKLVLNASTKIIFVDGGFSGNDVYMKLLASYFKDIEVFAAEVINASALGAAIVMHEYWNGRQLPANLVKLKKINLQ